MAEKTIATAPARQNNAPDRVQAGLDTDRTVFAVVILGVVLVLGVAVLVVGVRMNKRSK